MPSYIQEKRNEYNQYIQAMSTNWKESFLSRIREIEEMNLTRKVHALSMCTYQPGSFEKRFVRSLHEKEELSEKQTLFMNVLFFKYRKQHKLL